jgi:hypothetical protein
VALDTQKGPRPDRISPLIMEKIVLVVKKPLAILFNLSLLCPFDTLDKKSEYWNTCFYFLSDWLNFNFSLIPIHPASFSMPFGN